MFTSRQLLASIQYNAKKRGVVAHQNFASHADGVYMLEILIKESEK